MVVPLSAGQIDSLSPEKGAERYCATLLLAVAEGEKTQQMFSIGIKCQVFVYKIGSRQKKTISNFAFNVNQNIHMKNSFLSLVS